MRAGGFAEERVIDLVNRRFVPFYFEVSGRGCAASPEAKAFVREQTRNPWAFFAAFSPEGKLLGETALYADKEQIFEFLRSLLLRYPEFDVIAAGEQRQFQAAERPDATAAEVFAAARTLQELGEYTRARRAFQKVLCLPFEQTMSPLAAIELAKISRWQRDWESAREFREKAAQLVKEPTLALSDRIALERSHEELAHGRFREAHQELEKAIASWPQSRWLGEMRFYAGVACFFLGDRDMAKFHWCWVCENIPEDRLYQRCYFSATFEKNPYPNPELGRHDMDQKLNPSSSYSPATTTAAYAEAKKIYERMKLQR